VLGRGTELSTRSDGRDLPAWDAALKLLPLLDADAELATWRIAEGRPVAVFSRSDLPFEVHLAWSAGGGAGAEAKVTVARRKAAPSSAGMAASTTWTWARLPASWRFSTCQTVESASVSYTMA